MLSTVILRDAKQQCWYEYSHPREVLMAREHGEVTDTLGMIEDRVEREQLYAAGFVCYGAAAGFDQALPGQPPGCLPLICFGLFEQRRLLYEPPVGPRKGARRENEAPWRCCMDEHAYRRQVASLRGQIGAGDVYQINFTTLFQRPGRLDLGSFARIAGHAPYGAYVDGEKFTIVSASPELFFHRNGNLIACRPMKGTAARGLDSEGDLRAARWLGESSKNRAENLMITDMVRNDLGRIAQTASVAVPELFSVEQYPTVWQMTSTVTACSEVSVTGLFTALFPGASITGAPKRAAMECIQRVEEHPREIYTGCIGVMEPGGRAQFNIAIRTAWTDKESNVTYYGAGGGIVWDSDPAEEYQELLTKTRVLKTQPIEFDLLETMRWERSGGIFLRDEHLRRLEASARYFDYKFPRQKIEHRLDALHDELIRSGHAERRRVRLQIHKDGSYALECLPLPRSTGRLELALASEAVNTEDIYLYHKTTHRAQYEKAAEQVGEEYEALLYNQQGFVTESTIANLVYQLNGKRYTPPVRDGLLPGTLRGVLLREGEIEERSLHVRELEQVEDLYLVNALRGWRQGRLRRECGSD